MTETKLIKIDEKLKIQSQNEININPRDFLLQFLKDYKFYEKEDFFNFLKENKTDVLIDVIWMLSIEEKQKEENSQFSKLISTLVVSQKKKKIIFFILINIFFFFFFFI